MTSHESQKSSLEKDESHKTSLEKDTTEARLAKADSDCRRSQLEAAQLRHEVAELRVAVSSLKEELASREDQLSKLSSDFYILHRKYADGKDECQEIIWGSLVRSAPEYRALWRLPTVELESDKAVDEISLLGRLGKGAFGVVYRGLVDQPDGSKIAVALKAVPKSKIRTLVALRNLANEVACLTSLTDAKEANDERAGLEHVVTLFGASVSSSTVYLAQTMGGSDLFTLMSVCSCGSTLPAVMVTKISRGLMAAVAAVHRHGWCHRDIKPENLLVAVDAEALLRSAPTAEEAAAQLHVRLCDFGTSAQLPRSSADAPLTIFAGSVGFFAPELADRQRDCVPKSPQPPPRALG